MFVMSGYRTRICAITLQPRPVEKKGTNNVRTRNMELTSTQDPPPSETRQDRYLSDESAFTRSATTSPQSTHKPGLLQADRRLTSYDCADDGRASLRDRRIGISPPGDNPFGGSQQLAWPSHPGFGGQLGQTFGSVTLCGAPWKQSCSVRPRLTSKSGFAGRPSEQRCWALPNLLVILRPYWK